MECFTVDADEIGGRLDCHFYRPVFTKLDKKIKSISNKKLADYIISISGGATPEIKHSEKYYTDADKGIPFLRVQNVTHEGLNIDNVKYINEETHDGLLKRSQVKEFNLLTKITGVGRMAVSSVAPKGFIGNINQHLVVVETDSEKVSKVLATFLNSDVGEKLATKRSTGGTRPALDFKALKSIPIIFKSEIVEIMDNAYNLQKQKETESKQLLDSINDYVLYELDIILHELKDGMCYVVNADDVENGRIDPRYYKPFFTEFEKELSKRNDIKTIGELSDYIGSGATPRAGGSDYIIEDGGIPFIRIVNVKNNTIVLDDVLYIKPEIHRGMLRRTQLKPNDVLLSMAGTIGLSVVVPENFGEANINQALARIMLKECCNPYYISSILNSQIGKIQTDRLSRPAVQANINLEEIRALKIPLPPLQIQNKVADEIKARMQKAKQLQKEAKEVLKEAKERVEAIILG